MARRTLGSKLDENGGLGPGFDFLRVALALGVVFWHQPEIMFGPGQSRGLVMTLLAPSLLPMFFALSGFLIAASALRLSLGQFLINRGLRIFPALAVEVILCAFVLGPVFTRLPLAAYLTDPGTYRYLTNAAGIINYTLPGVFTANPSSTVNWSIWTVPCELACYAVIATMMLTGIVRRPVRVLLFSIAVLPALYAAQSLVPANALPILVKPTFFYVARPGIGLLIPFLFGVLCYSYRYRIPFHWGLAAVSSIPVAFLSVVRDPTDYPPLYAALLIGLAYLSAFIGLSRIPPLPVFRNGDYSYGIYLYGAPVQQAVRAALPDVRSAPALLVVALTAIVLFAMLSWHGIEKPVLGLRRRFSFVARARGVGRAADSRVAAPPPVRSATGEILTYGTPTETAPPGP